jgi:hypothetical protein
MCVTTPRVSKIGLTPASRSRATTSINLMKYSSPVVKCIETLLEESTTGNR